MDVKTRIKNDLWRYNYIIPFVKKYRFDGNGKIHLLKKMLQCYQAVSPVQCNGGERTVGRDTKALLESVRIDLSECAKDEFVYFIDTTKTIAVPGNVLSNFTLPYDKIIHGTFEELVRNARGEDTYGQEAERAAEGIRQLVRRITETLRTAEMDESVREKRMHDFGRMLDAPAEHLEEALQRILFFNQILWQTRHRLNGLGRLDKSLIDLYRKDMADGTIDAAGCEKMILAFLRQLSRYPEYKSDALMGDIGQIVILGGLEQDGSFLCNDLTKLFLKAQARLGRPDPKTLLRVSQNMPDDLLKLAVECLKSKTGSPLFSNDDVVIPALLDFGMPAQDAYNYCTSACWEPFIVGKSLDQNNMVVYDFFPALDAVLRRQSGFETFDELLKAYLEENDRRFCAFLKGLDAFKWARDPLVSLFTDGASEQREDVSEGSAKYNHYGITTVALGNTVDSLLNIKRLVFEEKRYQLNELENIRRNNFENQEPLRMALSKSKFYGHDNDEAISLVKAITGSVAERAKAYRNCFGGTVKFGLSSPGYNMLCRHTAADYSGRKTGMPYNTHISCTDAAYTEVVGFASQLDYTGQRFNGNVVDFFLPGQFLESNAEKFAVFLKGAIRQGFFQMQMNIMDSKTLIDAKAHPENYAGLIVRVWGFSAYFNDLPESYKDLLIERALAAEKVA